MMMMMMMMMLGGWCVRLGEGGRKSSSNDGERVGRSVRHVDPARRLPRRFADADRHLPAAASRDVLHGPGRPLPGRHGVRAGPGQPRRHGRHRRGPLPRKGPR